MSQSPPPQSNPSASPLSITFEQFQQLQQQYGSLQQQFNQQGHEFVQRYQQLEKEKSELERKVATAAININSNKKQGSAEAQSFIKAYKFNVFNGSGNVREWLDAIRRGLDFYSVAEHEKVKTAVMLFSSSVQQWWESLERENKAPNDWNGFCETVRSLYQPIATEDNARDQLDRCKQGSRSVQAYTIEFRTLRGYLPKMDEGDLKHRYIKNLNPVIKQEVLKLKLKSFEEVVEAAIRAEAYTTGYTRSNFGRPYGSYGSAYGNMRSASSSHSHNQSVPMDISNINDGDDDSDEEGVIANTNADLPSSIPPGSIPDEQLQQVLAAMYGNRFGNARPFRRGGAAGGFSKRRVPQASKEEAEHCIKNGMCINCKEKGHMARGCKNAYKPLKL